MTELKNHGQNIKQFSIIDWQSSFFSTKISRTESYPTIEVRQIFGLNFLLCHSTGLKFFDGILKQAKLWDTFSWKGETEKICLRSPQYLSPTSTGVQPRTIECKVWKNGIFSSTVVCSNWSYVLNKIILKVDFLYFASNEWIKQIDFIIIKIVFRKIRVNKLKYRVV